MASSPFSGLKGYTSKTIPFKSGPDGDILLDVVYPEESDGKPSTVLIHIHGGFLVSFVTYPMSLSNNSSDRRRQIQFSPILASQCRCCSQMVLR